MKGNINKVKDVPMDVRSKVSEKFIDIKPHVFPKNQRKLLWSQPNMRDGNSTKIKTRKVQIVSDISFEEVNICCILTYSSRSKILG